MRTKKLLIAVFAILSIATASMAQTIPSYVPSSGLVGWWPFNGNANDESGNRNNGTLTGATLTTDRFGYSNNAYSFNGNQYISIPYSSNYNYPNYSVSCWASTTSKSIQVILKQVTYSNASNERFVISLNDSKTNDVLFNVKYNSNLAGVGWQSNRVNNIVNDGKFHHFVGTVSANITRLYIDGVLVNTLTTQYSQSTITNGGEIQIGRDWNEAPFYFTGKIDDIGIWNRALTAQEISVLYQGCNLLFTTQPSNQTVGISSNATLSAMANSQSATYQWQTNPANIGWQNIPANTTYSGVNTSSLTVKNIQLSNHNQPFRVIATDGTCIDTSSVALIKIVDTCFVSVSTMDTLIINTTLTGLVSPNNHATIRMYPNPAKDNLLIDVDNYTSMSGYTITIANSLGQTVFAGLINKQTTKIDIFNLSGKGLYLVEIKDSQNRSITTKKLLIQ